MTSSKRACPSISTYICCVSWGQKVLNDKSGWEKQIDRHDKAKNDSELYSKCYAQLSDSVTKILTVDQYMQCKKPRWKTGTYSANALTSVDRKVPETKFRKPYQNGAKKQWKQTGRSGSQGSRLWSQPFTRSQHNRLLFNHQANLEHAKDWSIYQVSFRWRLRIAQGKGTYQPTINSRRTNF